MWRVESGFEEWRGSGSHMCFNNVISTSLEIGTQRPLKNTKKKKQIWTTKNLGVALPMSTTSVQHDKIRVGKELTARAFVSCLSVVCL